MKILRIQILSWLVGYISAISLLEVIQTTPQLSTLHSLLSSNDSANITNFLSAANNFTFLAPSNDAIATFNKAGTNLTGDLLFATLNYSLLHGGYPTLSITNTSQFVASNLVNASYTNVTAGQAVELVVDSGTPEAVTGNKAISTSTSTDIICVGGLVHVVDEVLTIPVSVVNEISDANLEYLISILNTAGYLNAVNGYVNNILGVPDITYFLPNSAQALADATALSRNSSAQELMEIFEYHVVPGVVAYSPMLTNGTTFKTAQGQNITVNVQDGNTYINAAKIIASDYIVANGVFHVLEDLLNRNDTAPPPRSTTSSAVPTPSPTQTNIQSPASTPSSSSTQSSGLSTGAKAGIGAGVGAAGLIGLMALLWFLVDSRRKKRESSAWDDQSMSGVPSDGGKYYVQRGGQVQRQEDLRLGLESAQMHNEIQNSPPYSVIPVNPTGPRPKIPPRSPSRVMESNAF